MKRALCAMLLAGCVEEGALEEAPGAEVGLVSMDEGVVELLPSASQAPPALPAGYLLLGASPMDQGDIYTLSVAGAPAGSVVNFLRGDLAGPGACPVQVGYQCLQIRQNVQSLGTAVANAAGEAVLQRQVPLVGLGRTLALEAVITGRVGWLSEAEERPVRPAGGGGRRFEMGPSFQLPSSSSVAPDVLLGHPIIVHDPVQVVELGIVGRFGQTGVRMAVYSDRNGLPDRLVTRTDPFNLQVGPVSEPVIQPVTLQAGTWWLMTNFEDPAATWSNGPLPGPEALVSLSFRAGMPAALNQPLSYTSPRINAYMVVE